MTRNCFLLLLALAAVAYGQPGFKAMLSSSGLNYLEGIGIKLLEKAVGTLNIPDINGEAGTPIGAIDYSLSSIVLDSFAIGGSSIGYTSSGIDLNIVGVTAAVHLNWHYRKKHWPHLSDHGSADIDVSVSASVAAALTESSGRPVVAVTGDSVDITDLTIHLHGGASWLYDLFINLFKGQIKSAIDKALQKAIADNVDKGLNKAFSTLPIEVTIGPNKEAEIDYEFVSNPVFTSSFMQLPLLGEFYVTKSPEECPASICPRSTTPDIINGEEVQMVASDFVANSAGYTFFTLGVLKAQFTDKDVPSFSPVRLNTSSFEFILPNLYETYPNDMMIVKLYSTQSPQTVFSRAGPSVLAPGNLEVDVILSNGTIKPAFILTGSISTAGAVALNGNVLQGNLTYLTGNFSLYQSWIGEFSVTPLDDILSYLFSYGIVPAANVFLQKGFEIPSVKGLTLISPTLGFDEHYLYITSNAQYTPPTD